MIHNNNGSNNSSSNIKTDIENLKRIEKEFETILTNCCSCVNPLLTIIQPTAKKLMTIRAALGHKEAKCIPSSIL